MNQRRTKEVAEAVLRELPSVLGASVKEDVNGHPREVHLLVAAGPDVRHLARDIRDLLQERLGIPVDQRVISIAQLGGEPAHTAPVDPEQPATDRAEPAPAEQPIAALPVAPDTAVGAAAGRARLVLAGLETVQSEGRVTVTVRLRSGDQEHIGRAVDLGTPPGRVRAAATAMLEAAAEACAGAVQLQLDGASVVRVLDLEYVLVAALALSPRLGRNPVLLSGVQEHHEDAERAAALAALKACNRVLDSAIDAEASAG